MLGPGSINFTPLFVDGLLIGLVIFAIGVWIWLGLPRARFFGIFVIVVGAIPTLLCLFILVADPISKMIDNWRNPVWTQVLPQDREIQGVRLPRGAKVEWIGKFMSDVVLEQPREVLGNPLEGEIKFGSVLESGTLASDHAIDGVPCKAHKPVEFFSPNTPGRDNRPARIGIGKLKHCTASAAFDFGENRYGANTEVTVNEVDGILLGVLAVDQYVDGYWCKQGTQLERSPKRAVRFTLARDEIVSGIACKAGTEVMLESGHGRVYSAVLAHDQRIGGITCRGGDAVTFVAHGDTDSLESCVTAGRVAILDVTWPPGTRLQSLSFGSLQATLPKGSAGVTIGEAKIVGGLNVQLSKSPPGLERVVRSDDQAAYVELRGARFTWLIVSYGVYSGQLAERATVDGVGYETGTVVDQKIGGPK